VSSDNGTTIQSDDFVLRSCSDKDPDKATIKVTLLNRLLIDLFTNLVNRKWPASNIPLRRATNCVVGVQFNVDTLLESQ
jgi:hypothetical protein